MRHHYTVRGVLALPTKLRPDRVRSILRQGRGIGSTGGLGGGVARHRTGWHPRERPLSPVRLRACRRHRLSYRLRGSTCHPEDSDDSNDTITGWVGDHQVPFLGFGVEINSFLYEKSPDDFDWFVETFPQVAKAVLGVSPGTVVFPGFQLERLRGLKVGLFGGERTTPEWELIDLFPEADAIGFTTYPGLVHRDPASLPTQYYDQILDHTDKPIIFTEVGWQAGGELGEATGTPAKQDAFVDYYLPKLSALSEMVIWSFLYDQEAGGPAFQSVGLIDSTGGERPAWSIWLETFR